MKVVNTKLKNKMIVYIVYIDKVDHQKKYRQSQFMNLLFEVFLNSIFFNK